MTIVLTKTVEDTLNLLRDGQEHTTEELFTKFKSPKQSIDKLRKAGYVINLVAGSRSEPSRFQLVSEPTPSATHDGLLSFGDLEIPCYVLEDGRRVISQRGMFSAIGKSAGSGERAGTGADALATPLFPIPESLKACLHGGFDRALAEGVLFQPTRKGRLAYGYDAKLLVEILDAYLEARKRGVLNPMQRHIADKAEMIVRALSRVAITALIDEATGYQDLRPKDELQRLLSLYVTEEYRKWKKTFSDPLYEEWFRLKQWSHLDPKTQRPACVGTITNNLVYSRILPGLTGELKDRRDGDPIQNKLHQYLTTEPGVKHLHNHLNTLLALAKATDTWDDYLRLVDRVIPVL